jgi:uridylate kinase
MPRYDRILLKLSGEALAGPGPFGIDAATLRALADEVASVGRAGVGLGLVVGGGNFFRGAASASPPGAARPMNRAAADSIGMLATVMNAIALADALTAAGLDTRVLTAVEMNRIAECHTPRAALDHMAAGRAVVFAAGTGNPYFSTDTGAAVRALEIGARVLAKGTSVDGVYDKDPRKHADAVRFEKLSHQEVLDRRLGVMDSSATALCRDHALPIVVFNMRVGGNIMRMAMGEPVGTVVG